MNTSDDSPGSTVSTSLASYSQTASCRPFLDKQEDVFFNQTSTITKLNWNPHLALTTGHLLNSVTLFALLNYAWSITGCYSRISLIGMSGEGKSGGEGVNTFARELPNMVHCQFLSSGVGGPKTKILTRIRQTLDTLSRRGWRLWYLLLPQSTEPQQVQTLPFAWDKMSFHRNERISSTFPGSGGAVGNNIPQNKLTQISTAVAWSSSISLLHLEQRVL